MKIMKNQKLFALTILFFVSLFFTSCGVWTDFTTYFNTYYNARTLFDATEESILEQNTDPFVFRTETQKQQSQSQSQTTAQNQAANNQYNQNRNTLNTQQEYQSSTTSTTNTGTTRTQTGSTGQYAQDLTKVIEKCSKILQFQQQSSYFDDALFMTGKSFYYQGEFARAQRKFMELAGLPESEYASENKLWLAKTHLQLRNFDEGLKLIEEVKDESLKNEDKELFSSASITKIGFLVYREEYTNAINECQNFLKNLDDDEMTALVWFQMGKIYIKQGDNENALKAFSSVLDFSPTFDVEFESKLEHALLLKEMGKLDESEEEISDLLNSGKFKGETGQIMYELGNIYYEKGNDEKAIETFIEVDSTYKNTPAAGSSSFMIGRIYKEQFGQYDSAYKYFNKTATSLAPVEIKNEASKNVVNFDKYFLARKSATNDEKSLLYIDNPTRFVQDSIDYDLANKEFMVVVNLKADSLEALKTTEQISDPNLRTTLEQQAKEQIRVESLRRVNSRKKDYIPTMVDFIKEGKITQPERPKLSSDSLKTLLSQDYYTLGSLFYSEMDVPDSAYFYYNEIIKKFTNKPSFVPTVFALGTFYETKEQKEKADSMYEIIYNNYPNDKLYTEAAIKLGKMKRDEHINTGVITDSAEVEYLAAEKKYYEKDYSGAIDGLKKVFRNYPKSVFKEKAIYFVGLIYEENIVDNDSAAAYYGILASKEYSTTNYGKAVAAKYGEYKKVKDAEEQEKIKQLAEQKKLEEEKNKLNAGAQAADSTARNLKNDEKNPDEKIEAPKLDKPTPDSSVTKGPGDKMPPEKDFPGEGNKPQGKKDIGPKGNKKFLDEDIIGPKRNKPVPDSTNSKKLNKEELLKDELLDEQINKNDSTKTKETNLKKSEIKESETVKKVVDSTAVKEKSDNKKEISEDKIVPKANKAIKDSSAVKDSVKTNLLKNNSTKVDAVKKDSLIIQEDSVKVQTINKLQQAVPDTTKK
jgi:tetratricopeptide (TPR) repeat protein